MQTTCTPRTIGASLAAVAGFLLTAHPALAAPIVFDDDSGFVNAAGTSEDFIIASATDWLMAGRPGSGMPLALTVTETTECLKTQSEPNGPCLTPSALFATGQNFVSDVTWRIEDTSGNGLPTLLWLTTVNLEGDAPAYTRGDVSIESDSAMLDGQATEFEVVRYSALFNGAPRDFFYLGLDLSEFGDAGDDGVAILKFSYSVDNPILAEGTPELAINAAQEFTPIPEPTTATLLGAGILTLLLGERRRRASQSHPASR